MGILRHRRTAAVLLLAVLVHAVPGSAPEARAALTQAELQAAFLVNFTKFVNWPASAFGSASAPIVLGILGEDPFGPALDAAVRGQRVNDRVIEAKRAGVRDDLSRFHVLFIGASEQKALGTILDRTAGAHVLTVSDIERFCEVGGSIGFVNSGSRVKFEVNVVATEERGLKVSTRLLSLAARVHTS